MKITLRIFALLGIFVFASGFWLTYAAPELIELTAKGFIKNRIVEKSNEKIDSMSEAVIDSKFGKLAKKLLLKNENTIIELKSKLKLLAQEKIDSVIVEMSNGDCECRNKYVQQLNNSITLQISSLRTANEKLLEFMKAKYMHIVGSLSLDIRIFTASNILMFCLLLLISLLKPHAIKHLFLPAVLLFISTIIGTYFYVFEQNWFFTIIYNDYMGYAYLAYITLLFLFLCDIVLNRATITSEIINTFLRAIGSLEFVSAC